MAGEEEIFRALNAGSHPALDVLALRRVGGNPFGMPWARRQCGEAHHATGIGVYRKRREKEH